LYGLNRDGRSLQTNRPKNFPTGCSIHPIRQAKDCPRSLRHPVYSRACSETRQFFSTIFYSA
jgi:hypothetical protein